MKGRFSHLLDMFILLALMLAAGGTPVTAQSQSNRGAKSPSNDGPHIFLPIIVSERFVSKDPTTYTYASFGDPDTLDPALDYETTGGSIIFNLYDTLIFYNRDDPNKFVPQIATEVPTKGNGGISPDSKTYTFTIRSEVKFHNGATLTAADVAYTFQRSILQGGSSSPQWLLTEPLLGVDIYDIAVLVDPNLVDDQVGIANADPIKLKAACNSVTSAIVADNSTGKVTFHLAQAFAPFLSVLSATWGSIQSKAWVSSNGGWDGSCDTWQNFYARTSSQLNNTPLGNSAMGTGPYKLDYWTAGTEIVLKSNENYWRTTPAWTGGPAGAPRLKTVIIKNIPDFNTRYAMLQSGDADSIVALSSNYAQMDALVGETCDTSGTCLPSANPINPFTLFSGLPSASRSDIFLNWQISTSGGNTFIGSGQLDGSGIPPDFFSDQHVRKALAYCFNYSSYLHNAFSDGGIRNIDVMLPGEIGYNASDPFYDYDTAKCEQEFKASTLGGTGGKSLWDTGFRMSIAYYTGNTSRQVIAQIFQQELAAVNSKFVIDVVELAWSDYLNAYQYNKLPMFYGGWLEDYHDTHQWVVTWTVGAYGSRQSMPSSLINQFQNLINQGVAETDPVARAAIYAQFNQLYYNQAPTLILFQGFGRHYQRRWVKGWYYNPVYWGAYYYSIYKR